LTLIKQNIGGALVIKALVMLLGVLGYASMWTAVFADTGVALLAVINSLRALRKMR
jgi:Cd2+/Zn2+-exporting ATPase